MTQIQNEQKVEELFNKVTADIGHQDIRGITLQSFSYAIEKMIIQAYYQGMQDGIDQLDSSIKRVLEPLNLTL